MKLSRDFNEFLSCLAVEGVRYLLVGGYALAAHGLPRFTKDIDIWVACDAANADRIRGFQRTCDRGHRHPGRTCLALVDRLLPQRS